MKPCFSLSHQPFSCLANIVVCFRTVSLNLLLNFTRCISNTLPLLVVYCAWVMVYAASVGVVVSSLELFCSNFRCSVKRSFISEIMRASSNISLWPCAASCSLCSSSMRDLISESLSTCVLELCSSTLLTDLYSANALVLRWLLSIHFLKSSKFTAVTTVLWLFAQSLS